jgi:hypothetical protein
MIAIIKWKKQIVTEMKKPLLMRWTIGCNAAPFALTHNWTFVLNTAVTNSALIALSGWFSSFYTMHEEIELYYLIFSLLTVMLQKSSLRLGV